VKLQGERTVNAQGNEMTVLSNNDGRLTTMALSRQQPISARFHDNARQIRFVIQARKEILIIACV
jgi:hypothetical protein